MRRWARTRRQTSRLGVALITIAGQANASGGGQGNVLRQAQWKNMFDLS